MIMDLIQLVLYPTCYATNEQRIEMPEWSLADIILIILLLICCTICYTNGV